MLESFVSSYCFNISGSMCKYCVLPSILNFFHFLCFIVLFHLSTALDFSSFSVEYIVVSCLFNNSLRFLLQNFLPLSIHRCCGRLPSLKMVLNASVTVLPYLLKGFSIHIY